MTVDEETLPVGSREYQADEVSIYFQDGLHIYTMK